MGQTKSGKRSFWSLAHSFPAPHAGMSQASITAGAHTPCSPPCHASLEELVLQHLVLTNGLRSSHCSQQGHTSCWHALHAKGSPVLCRQLMKYGQRTAVL